MKVAQEVAQEVVGYFKHLDNNWTTHWERMYQSLQHDVVCYCFLFSIQMTKWHCMSDSIRISSYSDFLADFMAPTPSEVSNFERVWQLSSHGKYLIRCPVMLEWQQIPVAKMADIAIRQLLSVPTTSTSSECVFQCVVGLDWLKDDALWQHQISQNLFVLKLNWHWPVSYTHLTLPTKRIV